MSRAARWEPGARREPADTSQGRDNAVRFYAPLPSSGAPPLTREMPSNALNFCAFSLAYMPGYAAASAPPISLSTEPPSKPTAALLALPNLTDSELVRL